MTNRTRTAASPDAVKRQITLERTFRAPLQDVWDLWTTKDGIESWWGPEGFSVTVQKLELHPGGEMIYTMAATGPEQIAFMKRSGMPVATTCRITFREVTPLQRLAYENLADFIPGTKPYTVDTIVELQPVGDTVRLLLTLDAMHSDEWTQRMAMGWEGQLGKLTRLLEARFGGAR